MILVGPGVGTETVHEGVAVPPMLIRRLPSKSCFKHGPAHALANCFFNGISKPESTEVIRCFLKKAAPVETGPESVCIRALLH